MASYVFHVYTVIFFDAYWHILGTLLPIASSFLSAPKNLGLHAMTALRSESRHDCDSVHAHWGRRYPEGIGAACQLCSVQHDDHPAAVLSDPHQQPLGPPSAELRYQSTILGFRQQFALVHAIMECPDTIDLTPLTAQMLCR